MKNNPVKKKFDGFLFSSGEEKGLQAIKGNEKKKFKCNKSGNEAYIRASVNIDNTMIKKFPNDSRWDYAIWYEEKAAIIFFAEIHPVKSSEIDSILKKKEWLDKLIKGSQNIDFLGGSKNYFWVPTGSGCKIIPSSNQYKRIATNGIKIKSIVLLDNE